MPVYEPEEDSFLLKETLEKYLLTKDKCIKILDMGSGSGILAQACIDMGFKDVLAVDIDKEAIEHLKKQRINAIQSDLFDDYKFQEKFDLIIFNPPYLPEDKYDKQADTTAGKKGYEIIARFLKQAKSHLNKNGVILLLFSSLSKPNIITKQAKTIGYNYKLLNKKKLFFEELYVIICTF